jgi:hypothetical protein
VEAAEASARAAGAALYPQLNLLAKGGGKMGGDATAIVAGGLFASWELDLWGACARSAARPRAIRGHVLDARTRAIPSPRSSRRAGSSRARRRCSAHRPRDGAVVAGPRGLARDRLRIGKGDEYDVVQADSSVLPYRDLALQADRARQEALRAVEILAGRYPRAEVDAEWTCRAASSIPVGCPRSCSSAVPTCAPPSAAWPRFHRTTEARARALPRIALTPS